jgi:phosphoglycolate phosphatase
MGTKTLIIYDLDGTVANTSRDLLNAANHMLKSFGLPARDLEQVIKHVGRGGRNFVKGLLGTEDEKLAAEGLKTLTGYYSEHLLDNTELYPGVLEALERMSGRTQVLLSNKDHDLTVRIAEELGIAGFFTMVAGLTDKWPRKPDPAVIQEIMRRHKASSPETVLVGDSLVDSETARRAGIDFIGVSYGFGGREQLETARHLRIVDSLAELPDII